MSPLPLPPFEMRVLVGPTDAADYDNPGGGLVFPFLDEEALYENVLDFGCGCGRIARQLLQQHPQPKRYLGLDLHAGMIRWCTSNLAAAGFEFCHHDVYDTVFNPDRSRPDMLPFPAADRSVSLVLAWSVFTHLSQPQGEHYLGEVARVLSPRGVLASTWFLFDKREFPMLQAGADALYINHVHPGAAVIFDRAWLRATASRLGLTIYAATPPGKRGYQWTILMAPKAAGRPGAVLVADTAPLGAVELHAPPADANRIGCN